ncbi:MAG: extracellular solute-binding protein [Thermomicrobiales bacterium]
MTENTLLHGKVSRRTFAKGVAAAPVALGVARGYDRAAAQDNVKLTVLTHWAPAEQKEPLEAIFQTYMDANPGVEIVLETVAFEELLKRITTGALGGGANDIFHIYNLWLPELSGSDLLATPPESVSTDVSAAYAPGTVAGASYGETIWGFPTEVNVYQLVYNKAMLEAAGVTVPAKLSELRDAAAACTIKDGDTVTQAGFLFQATWDSGVVHPFTSLLWSNNGQYVNEDNTEALFNQQPGVDVLQVECDIFADGSALTGVPQDADFESGRAAMTIMANWWGAQLKASDIGMENVGVAPIPVGEGGTSTALQYEWLWTVSNTSANAEAAWNFLTWLNSPVAEGASSPMGDYLTSALNAIPGRTSDQEAHADVLGDDFVAPFVAALATAKTEPILPGAQEIKTGLQTQIESAWFGETDPQTALNTAAEQANGILAENAG